MFMRHAHAASLLILALFAAPFSTMARPAPAPFAFAASDVPLDPAFRFGRLANGMRYVIRHNETPRGAVLVRMEVVAGALDENDAERGFAHFVEHMTFQGSTHVPEGEMVRLLERRGLAFGADTNAQTGFERTTYLLDLPTNDAALIDTALMLMRETASELSFPEAAVARERGVVLAEMRDRNTWSMRELEDRLVFNTPRARFIKRLPIGTTDTLNQATAASLRGFWRRHYTPANTTLVVIGDVDVAATQAAITSHFGNWPAAPTPAQPSPGPVDTSDGGRSHIYLDPSLSERITVSQTGAWQDEPDRLAQRREELLRRIGYGIVNRRLQALSRSTDAPFHDAGLGTGDVFHIARNTNLVVDAVDGHWQVALIAAATEYHRALSFGFTAAEIAEQLANIQTQAEHAAAASTTRSDNELVNAVFALLHDDRVPTDPRETLRQLVAFTPRITPDAVLAALKREAVPLTNPLIRYQGRHAPGTDAAGIRAVWTEAMAKPLEQAKAKPASAFAYDDFGPAGKVVADSREPGLGIREIRFANGVRLNLKPTSLVHDQVLVQISLDGGQMLATKANPLAVDMLQMLPAGGLGKASQDELQSQLAGHAVGTGFANGADSFQLSGRTTPADLALQLQLSTAFITDPGFRPEGEIRYRQAIIDGFARLRATPQAALASGMGGLLSDNDPRFTLQPLPAYRALGFARLKQDIGERLAHGAIEVGLVGDFNEDEAIALVGKTLGALPEREPDFRAYADQRQRGFTRDHSPRTLTHTGPADQALLRVTWATRDDSDPVEKQVLNLLGRLTQIEMTEVLRQRLGKTYSPGATSEQSRNWRGYGTFAVSSSVNVADVAATRAAIFETIASLRNTPVNADILLRARQPLVESFENALKSNSGWLALVARAQSEPDRIDRQLKAKERLLAVTAEDVRHAANAYLGDAAAVEITVLPEAAALPPPPASTARTEARN